MTSSQRLLALLGFVAASAALSGQVTIGSSSTGGYASVFNGSFLQTFAQVIQPPSGNPQINDFTFYMSAGGPGGNFTAAIMEWDVANLHPTGAPLWVSSSQTVLNSANATPFTFSTGGVELDPIKSYALVAMADNGPGVVSVGLHYATSDILGSSFWLGAGAGGSYADITGQSWHTNGSSDIAYLASFSPVSEISAVPEPSLPGLSIGLSGLAAFAAWRRRKAARTSVVASPVAV